MLAKSSPTKMLSKKGYNTQRVFSATLPNKVVLLESIFNYFQ